MPVSATATETCAEPQSEVACSAAEGSAPTAPLDADGLPGPAAAEPATERSLEEVLAELNRPYSGKLPVWALRETQRRREEITPHLIEFIRNATQTVREGRTPEGEGHFFAFFLLTEFRAAGALPAILEAISLPGDGPFEMFGDVITSSLREALAVLPSDIGLIGQLIENASLNQFVRWTAVGAYLHLVGNGRLTREEAVERLGGHLRDAMARRDEQIVTFLVCELLDYAPVEALDDISNAFRMQLVDESVVDQSCVRRSIAEGQQGFQRTLATRAALGDTVEHLSGWAAFEDKPFRASRAGSPDRFSPFDPDALDDLEPVGRPHFDEDGWDTAESVRRTTPRVGRNDPCPCGSGKKFKKCCRGK